MEKRALGLIEVEGREQRYTRRLAISGFSRNTREYLYACIGCIRSVYTYPLFSLPGGSPTSRISPLKLDGVYHEPGGNARSIRYVRTLPRSHELSVPRTAIPSLNRNGNVGRSRRPDRHPSPHSLCTAEGGRIMHLRGLSCSIVGCEFVGYGTPCFAKLLARWPGFNEQLAARWKRAKHQGRGGSNSGSL